MDESEPTGWKRLVEDYVPFDGAGHFPLPAYSEFMPPPRLGRTPYGTYDDLFSDDDPFGWRVGEMEQQYELAPGLQQIGHEILGQVIDLGKSFPAHHIAGHRRRNLEDNPYWPPELAEHAGHLVHERYLCLIPLALSRTQDDMGRVRWTLFGGSEQGPERAFWRSFYTAPGKEVAADRAIELLAGLLREVYQEPARDASGLMHAGLRILPSSPSRANQEWIENELPTWTKDFTVGEDSSFADVRYLLTFRAFVDLPGLARQEYLHGRLHLIPFPGSLVFWGMKPYLRLQKQLKFALQLPLQRLAIRHDGPEGIRVPQTGWLHEPRQDETESHVQEELLLNTYRRTNRWNRVHRYDDNVAASEKVGKIAQVLFSTSSQDLDLYDKPMARNAQLWSEEGELLLDGPEASRAQIEKAAAALLEGGIFRYRFQFPPMQVGHYQVFWQRPIVAFRSSTGQSKVRADLLDGYLTAYRSDAPDLGHGVELYPRLLRRPTYESALSHFESPHDHYAHQTALNLVALLDAWEQTNRQPLPASFGRQLIRTAKEESIEQWLESLSIHSSDRAEADQMQQVMHTILKPDPDLPEPITYAATATRAYEENYWSDILTLSHGRYVTKDNADVVQDAPTLARVDRQRRDLELLGEYLIERHRKAIASAGMEGKAFVGDLPFRWQTDFDFPLFGGWKENQEGHPRERNILVVIPGRNRAEAVVLGDHYDTAYMEDVYEKSRGGSGARLAAPGADDNHSATATLLQAAPIFLKLSSEGRLERDIWLLHLTGEEFPSDCLGARAFCRSVLERTMALHVADGETLDLSTVRLAGVFVMDMIAHNRDNAQDIFQISPGRGKESLQLAYQAHLANAVWNGMTKEWNERVERRERGRGRRSADGVTLPEIARHPVLEGQVRTRDDPQSSLYNTDCQIFSDIGAPVVLFMENYDINRTGYHDTKDTMENIDLDYGAALSAIAIETVARVAMLRSPASDQSAGGTSKGT